MTHDLIKRLRRDLASGLSASIGDTQEAADTIEGLDQLLRIRTSQYNSCCKDKVADDARIKELENALIWIIENEYNLNVTIEEKKKAVRAALEKANDQ